MAVSRSFDRVADVYDATRGGEKRGAEVAAELVPRLVPGLVLEVGVGTGVVSGALRRHGYQTIGVDLSAAMLAHAVRRLGTGRLVRADARALPLRDSTVDNAVYVAALHVIGDVAGAVREAARVLRPGGRLVVVHAGWERGPTDIAQAVAQLVAASNARRADTPAVLDPAAAAAGLRLVVRTATVPVRLAETPNAEADAIERRLWSFLWDIDDATWRDVVEPTVARLRALPEPDRPRPEERRGQVSVFTR